MGWRKDDELSFISVQFKKAGGEYSRYTLWDPEKFFVNTWTREVDMSVVSISGIKGHGIL